MNEKPKLEKDLLLELTQLRESENRWRTLAQSSPDHILSLANDLTIQSVNHPAPGLTIEELIGNPITSFLPEDRQTEVKAILQGVIDTGQPALYETEHHAPDGEVIYYETHASQRLSDDRAEGLTLNSRDVTIRKQIEKEINHQGDLIKSIYLSAPIGIGMVTDRIILEANDRLCDMVGYKRDELINQNARMLYPTQADFDFVGQEKYNQISKLRIGTVETLFLKKDGGVIDVLLSSTPIDHDDLSKGVTFSALDITELNRMGEELKIAALKWQHTFDAVSDAICILDSEQKVIQTNQVMNEMFPEESGKMIGKYCFEIVHSSTEPVENCPVRRMRQTLKREHMELPHGDRTLEVIVDPILDDSGVLTGAVHSIRDITIRKQAEETVGQSEERIRELYNNMSNGVCIYNAVDGGKDFVFTDINKSGEQSANVIKSQILGKSIYEIRPNIDEFGLVDVFRRVWKTGKPETHDEKFYEDEHLQGFFRNYVYRLSSGEVVAIFEDLTEQKVAEQALSHTYDLMTYIIEHNRSSVAVHDRDLKYIYVSNRYLEEYNVKDPNIIGKHHYDVFPDLPQKWRDVHQKALAGEISSGDNDPYYRDDGTVDWTRWECRPWYEEDGSIGGIIVYTEVITDQIRAGQEKDILLKQVNEANQRLRSLSRELINSQEAERKRISQELHDELGQALTAISLDLGLIEQNLHPETSPEIKDKLSDTKKNADGLDQMIRELALDLRPSLLDDLGLLPTLNWYVERFSQRSEIEVVVDGISEEKRLPEEIETALYRIIQEALTNVVKHAKAKKVGLRIDIGEGVVILNIEDDGKGFDADSLQFPEKSPRGLGLIGMADRTALVGGDIRIHSKPGEGTRIEIEIPL